MTNKMTKVQWYEILKSVVEASDVENKEGAVDFINHEIELINSKSNSRKATAKQEANVGIKAVIKETLGKADKPMTVGELIAAIPEYEEMKNGQVETVTMSSQKMSALLTLLRKEGAVVRTEEKKKAYFALAD